MLSIKDVLISITKQTFPRGFAFNTTKFFGRPPKRGEYEVQTEHAVNIIGYEAISEAVEFGYVPITELQFQQLMRTINGV